MSGQRSGLLEASVTVPFDRDRIAQILASQEFRPHSASIREMDALVSAIEQELKTEFVRMEFGIPGLPAHPVAVEAEVRALREPNVANAYAPFGGLPELKREAARFVKSFMGLDVPPACCVPTVGAMEGCFVSIALASRVRKDRRTLLMLEPGFPVNKLQARFLGVRTEGIDFYDHRGQTLLDAVEARVSAGDVFGILWSSPNNPSWIVLKESELEGLGRICDRHGVMAIEDLAYFGMDTRQDYSVPGRPPYQPTVLRYTERGICIISSSKMFSYAGQRIALSVLSPKLMTITSPDLEEHFGTASVGRAFVPGLHYPLVASVPQGPQHGLLALLRAANEGDRSVFAAAREYSRRAGIMKRLFLDHGFRLVYDTDLNEPLGDGFYFTFAHPGFEHGGDLLVELLHYGISAITLETTGSCRTEGLRACVSMTDDRALERLGRRLRRFQHDHPA